MVKMKKLDEILINYHCHHYHYHLMMITKRMMMEVVKLRLLGRVYHVTLVLGRHQ